MCVLLSFLKAFGENPEELGRDGQGLPGRESDRAVLLLHLIFSLCHAEALERMLNFNNQVDSKTSWQVWTLLFRVV